MNVLADKAVLADTSSWGSYPKVYGMGNRALNELFSGPVSVEEKVDGSQFSFGVFEGVLKCRSKGVEIDIESPEKMFAEAVSVCKDILSEGKYIDGFTYRGEYLKSQKHNTLQYGRVPKRHIMGFDVSPQKGAHLSYEEKKVLFGNIGLETTPLLFEGETSLSNIGHLLDNFSILGETKIEGIVIKNNNKFDPSGAPLVGKLVSREFQEVHQKEWKDKNPNSADIISILGDSYRTEARWNKSIQHLRDSGKLKGEARDIGVLMTHLPQDILSECEAMIKDQLFSWAWPQIKRLVVRGFPEYYKDYLINVEIERQVEHEKTTITNS